MSNQLFQTIDQISREKGIDPQIVVHAIEDAIVVASRKYFKSNEELRGRINPDTGEIDVYALRKVVEEVTNPVREISMEEARSIKPDAQMEDEIEFLKPTVGLGRIAAGGGRHESGLEDSGPTGGTEAIRPQGHVRADELGRR